MNGKIKDIETMGSADGPGIRLVLFMAGCKLRCAYCHNPETWIMSNYKREISSEEKLKITYSLVQFSNAPSAISRFFIFSFKVSIVRFVRFLKSFLAIASPLVSVKFSMLSGKYLTRLVGHVAYTSEHPSKAPS